MYKARFPQTESKTAKSKIEKDKLKESVSGEFLTSIGNVVIKISGNVVKILRQPLEPTVGVEGDGQLFGIYRLTDGRFISDNMQASELLKIVMLVARENPRSPLVERIIANL